jgi:UDP-xylose/UDP-N-acetylglucosamine transporter B4
VLVAAVGYASQFSARHPPFFLKPNQVPLRRWLAYIVLFFSVNMLNNYAFGCRISVPLHIILRSGGSVTTMAAGWLWGKRYSWRQVVAVNLLTLGVILSAIADAEAKVRREKKEHKSCFYVLFFLEFTNIGIFLLNLLNAMFIVAIFCSFFCFCVCVFLFLLEEKNFFFSYSFFYLKKKSRTPLGQKVFFFILLFL